MDILLVSLNLLATILKARPRSGKALIFEQSKDFCPGYFFFPLKA